MVNLRLFNGAHTKDAWDDTSPEFIDDWKPEELIIPAEYVQVTYRDHIKVKRPDADAILDLIWDDQGLIEHEGVFYGDFTIYSQPQLLDLRRGVG